MSANNKGWLHCGIVAFPIGFLFFLLLCKSHFYSFMHSVYITVSYESRAQHTRSDFWAVHWQSGSGNIAEKSLLSLPLLLRPQMRKWIRSYKNTFLWIKDALEILAAPNSPNNNFEQMMCLYFSSKNEIW